MLQLPQMGDLAEELKGREVELAFSSWKAGLCASAWSCVFVRGN